MKNNILLWILIVFSREPLFSQYYEQYFDGDNTSPSNSVIIEFEPSQDNIWQIGKPQKEIFNKAATSPNVLITDTINPYPPKNISSFQFKIQPYWSGILAVQWLQKLDMESGEDAGIIEFSFDKGDTWYNAFNNPYVYNFFGFDSANQVVMDNNEQAFSGTDTIWRNVWLCFEYSWLNYINEDLYFRFTFQSGVSDSKKDGWMIDNLTAHVSVIHTISNKKSEQYLTVYPNPVKDILYIETEKIQAFHIIERMELINAQGQLVDKWENIPTKFFIDTRKYSNGAYFLNIQTNIKSETVRVSIEHN